MYSWMVYVHVLATFVFLTIHGASSIVSLRLRNQRDPALARSWLALYADHGVYGASMAHCSCSSSAALSVGLWAIGGVRAGFGCRWLCSSASLPPCSSSAADITPDYGKRWACLGSTVERFSHPVSRLRSRRSMPFWQARPPCR